MFRGIPLIDRVKERKDIINWFEKVPQEILWIYGPKSTGKTTVIEYIVENELFDDFTLFKSEKYNVKYINFRRKLFGSYDSFINSMLTKDDIVRKSSTASINLGVFKIEAKIYDSIKEKTVDLFDELYDNLKNSKKKNILIFDEIQSLQGIYIDKERELLNEFLNFCVSLTKESHLSHVVLLSSNTIFINEIYNNAKLKVTSTFYKIDHLKKDTIFKYFKDSFTKDELELAYEYLGGSIAHIQKLIRMREQFESLEDALQDMQQLALSEIILKFRGLTDGEIDAFKKLVKDILVSSFFDLQKEPNNPLLNKMIDEFCEIEILFFEPANNKIFANSKIYAKAFEILLT